MKTTTGIFNDRSSAENLITELKELGLGENDISYVYINKENGKMVDGDVNAANAVGEGAGEGAKTGLIIGALAGLVVAAGILPGLGALFVAGPLATALGLSGAATTTVAGAVTGAAAGGLIGALAGLGVSKSDAELYEESLKKGGILVIARSAQGDLEMLFEKFGATEVRQYMA